MEQTRENEQKPHFDPFLTPFWPKIGGRQFFFENRNSELFLFYYFLILCKKAKKSYGGKYHNFCYGQTTDKHGSIGPKMLGPKNQNSTILRNFSTGTVTNFFWWINKYRRLRNQVLATYVNKPAGKDPTLRDRRIEG